MAEITLTIDDKEVKGELGDTVLQICQKNGIYVPTLCHLDGLPDIGSCRMCIVDIQGPGRPRVSTACTTPAMDGMVLNTNTASINAMRKNILEFLLSEGNHHCMYCLSSGDCELQDLAYKFNIDYIRTPKSPYEKPVPVDSSHRYLVMDPNRCILCYRCVRVCNDVQGNRVLGIGGRGSKSQIISDLGGSRGKSSCISCGMCVQVCPTGALTDRRSSYMGRETQVNRVKTTCMFCSVGCGEELVTRDNYLIRIEGDWDAEPNYGLMCSVGRYEPLYDEKRTRAVRTMLMKDGQLERIVRDAALNLVADKMDEFPKEATAIIVSTQATNESMDLIAEACKAFGVSNLSCLEGKISEPDSKTNELGELADADMFIVVGEDLTKDHQVVGFLVKRYIVEQTKQLVIVDDDENGLAPFANHVIKPNEVEKVIELAKTAKKPVIIYGAKAGKEMELLRRELAIKAKFYWMPKGVNSRGALAVGINGSFDAISAKFVYILAAEAKDIPDELIEKLKRAEFVVVQTSYIQPWDQVADVIIPSPIWAEKEGSTTNLEGRVLKLAKAVNPPIEVNDELDTLLELMEKLGYSPMNNKMVSNT